VNGGAFHASEPISTDQLSNERIIPGPNPNYGALHMYVTCVEVFRQPQEDAMVQGLEHGSASCVL
jgi:hypothetical protein